MTNESLLQALEESTQEVLETMFFIQCLGTPFESAREREVVAHLTFEGDPSGAFRLRVTADAARSVAADFLGAEEPELSEREIGEVVCELANMICGSVLSRVESTATFRLATPRIVGSEDDLGECSGRGPASSAMGPEHSTVHAVEIGGGRIMVSINTETLAWPKAEKYVS